MKSRYLFAIAIVAAIIGGGLVTLNRQHATRLANTITAKDQSAGYYEPDLAQLQTFVKAHMLTSTTVFLSGSYDRAVHNASVNSSAVDPAIYSSAQASCASHADSIAQAKCVSAYVAAHAAPQANPQPQAQPNKADFMKTYTAPGWTPDLAGLALAVAAVFGIVGIYLLIYRKL